ncbi:MAG: hypothetical protein BMS9Abin07_1859 [Acidimicrobiia bacterium]|nr:MAG: hypothetical protein BMS9Abin07_1859 [Acidimicrobiia bacterium]
MSLPELSIPELEPPFDGALAAALDYVFEIHDDVVSINLAGSVIRGEPDARSDLDLYVIIGGELRHRVQRIFAGVPTEMFFNNEQRARGYFEQDKLQGRAPAVALMAFGHIIYDPDGVFARLRADALDVMERGPTVPEETLTVRRYGAVDRMDNALDVVDRDPTMARILATEAVSQAIAVWFVERGGWIPRGKDRLQALRTIDPEAAIAVERFIDSGSVSEAEEAIAVLLGVGGFFEWDSLPEP